MPEYQQLKLGRRFAMRSDDYKIKHRNRITASTSAKSIDALYPSGKRVS